jgi:predicted RNase H-like HicB family nuclease
MPTTLRPLTPASEPIVGYDALVVSRVDDDRSLYYLASHPELPGCLAHGATPDEALENLADALDLYRKMAAESRATLPAPHTDPRTTVASHTPSADATGSGATVTTTATTVVPISHRWSLAKAEGEEERPAFRELLAV